MKCLPWKGPFLLLLRLLRYSLVVLAFGDLGLGRGALGFCAPCLILDGKLLDVAADFKADFCFDLPF